MSAPQYQNPKPTEGINYSHEHPFVDNRMPVSVTDVRPSDVTVKSKVAPTSLMFVTETLLMPGTTGCCTSVVNTTRLLKVVPAELVANALV
ncbi:MAG TPA: hypothetical protein DCW52_06700 [Gammaproteobacteria bacterium]|jgi:hypothetical protein|nr:hypothetical protein [Gammaproteobacteria bacterium]